MDGSVFDWTYRLKSIKEKQGVHKTLPVSPGKKYPEQMKGRSLKERRGTVRTKKPNRGERHAKFLKEQGRRKLRMR